MSTRFPALLPLFAVFALGAAMPAAAGGDEVERFATLPKGGPGFPEGIAADEIQSAFAQLFVSFRDRVEQLQLRFQESQLDRRDQRELRRRNG